MVLSNKEWLDKMNEIISAIQNGGCDSQVIEDMLSNMWISSVTYNVGDYVLYNNNIWKCLVQNSNIAPSEGTTWTRVNITSEISTLNSNLSKKQDKLKIKDVNIKLKNYSFQKSAYFYYSNIETSDLIGSHSMILSATIVWWAGLTNPIVLQFDVDGIYLSLTIPKDSMNDWMDNSQINVRFTYL